MFRLDRAGLYCPCDLCIHNPARGCLGTQLYTFKACKFCKDAILKNGYADCFIPFAQGSDSFIMKVFCEHFELNIDALEKVVYNKLGFAISWGTVGRIDQNGNVAYAYDPLWVVMNSLNLVFRDDRTLKTKFNKMPTILQKIYPMYCKNTDEEKCLMATSMWYSIETKQFLLNLSSRAREALKDSPAADELSHVKIRAILNYFGHPLFTKENIDSDDAVIQDKLYAVLERVNEITRKIAAEEKMYVKTL